MPRRLTLVVAAMVALIVVTVAGAVGELAQKPGTAGCVSEDGTAGACQDGKALLGASGVEVSLDGNSIYATAAGSDAVAIFDRDPSTGSVLQKSGIAGCISETGSNGECYDGRALDGAKAVAASADGKHVYVVSDVANSISIFDRQLTSGALIERSPPAGCIAESGPCVHVSPLFGASSLALSPNGANVYVSAGTSDAVTIFDRAADGTLTRKSATSGCISESGHGGACQDGNGLDGASDIVATADGKNVYVASADANALVILDRDPMTGSLAQKPGALGCSSESGSSGTCQDGKALVSPRALAVSADGKNVYVASYFSGAVAVFDRDPATGALVQRSGTAGCISDDGTGGACQDGTALGGMQGVQLASDGSTVYTAAETPDAVAIFDRDPATGALAQKVGVAGCVAETGAGGACQVVAPLNFPLALALSPDGGNLYVATAHSNAITIFDRATPPPPVPPPPPPPLPPPPPPPAPPARDRTAPVVSEFAVVPSRFRVGRLSSFRFRLSERANAGILLERALPGRRVGRRCVAPARRNRGRGRCTRFVRAGTLTFRNRPAGANNLVFRTRGRRLGAYRVTITARDPAGNRSKPRRAGFRIVRR